MKKSQASNQIATILRENENVPLDIVATKVIDALVALGMQPPKVAVPDLKKFHFGSKTPMQYSKREWESE